jgi:hypothetical protein
MFKAGFYETEVTPPLGTYMPGCAKVRYAENVKDKVYAKAVVIDNGKETVAAVVLDSVSLPVDAHDIIVKRVGEYTGIKAENIIVTANHTHEGAPMNDAPLLRAFVEPAYVNIVVRLMADAITLAYRNMQNVRIKYGCGEAYGISFNRNFVMRDGTISTNTGRSIFEVTEENISPEVPVVKITDAHKNFDGKIINPNCVGNLAGIDPQVPVLSFENEQGEIIGAIINFACHQTCLSRLELSGDYSSILSKELKKIYGPDFVSFFIAGTCGDINHINPTIPQMPDDTYIKMGKVLAKEAKRAIEEGEEVQGEHLFSIKELVSLKVREVDEDDLKEQAKRFCDGSSSLLRIRGLIDFYSNNKRKTMDVYVQCIRIGDVYFYALPGEVYVNFGLNIKENSPSQKNLITELANSNVGYIPIREAFLPQASLYEATPNMKTCMEEETGYILTDKALEIAKKLAD